MIILDLVWPALSIGSSVYKFWFLFFVVILTEAVFIRYLLKTSNTKSLIISAAGNLISGVAGTFVMMFASVLYHAVADTLLFESTFNTFNWIASYIIMCFGSVFIEIIAVKIIWKFEFRKLIVPLTAGNVLGYILILFLNSFNY